MSSILSTAPGIFCIQFLPWVAGKLFSPRAANSASVAVWKALPSLSILSLAGALCLASLFFIAGRHEGASAGRCCGQFLMVVHVLPFVQMAPMGSRWPHTYMFITGRVPDISSGVINKDLHSISGQNNKISRDVKGLFLGVTFVSCRVIVSVVVKLQLEDELHVQVGCSVRRLKGLLGLSPLGLISRLLRG